MDTTQALLTAVTIILTLVGVIGTMLLTSIRAVLRAQGEQDRKLSNLNALLLGPEGAPKIGLVEKVNDLHAWRDQLQREALDDYRRQVRDAHRLAAEGGA